MSSTKVRRVYGWMKPGLAPEIKPSNMDIAWAAGIYEGEGSCSLKKLSVKVQIAQKDTWILHRLRSLFGGSVLFLDSKRIFMYWAIYGPRARGFLLTVYPFLSPWRRAQARNNIGWGKG